MSIAAMKKNDVSKAEIRETLDRWMKIFLTMAVDYNRPHEACIRISNLDKAVAVLLMASSGTLRVIDDNDYEVILNALLNTSMRH